MSYGFTANIKQIIINGQNKTILTKQTVSVPDEKTGNCRKTKDCPVAERCLKVYVIYPSIEYQQRNQPVTNLRQPHR